MMMTVIAQMGLLAASRDGGVRLDIKLIEMIVGGVGIKTKIVKTLNPIHPNIGIELHYRRKMEALIDNMHNSILYWLSAAYKQNIPELRKLIAEDASPTALLRAVMRRL